MCKFLREVPDGLFENGFAAGFERGNHPFSLGLRMFSKSPSGAPLGEGVIKGYNEVIKGREIPWRYEL